MTYTAEKLLPQNVEAEAGVLGSLLIDPAAIAEVADFLTAPMFYREVHRELYQVILDLYERETPADLITVTDELQRRNLLDEMGGVSYVSSLANQVPTSANVEHYARIVERTAAHRALIRAAGQIAGIAYSDPSLDEAQAQSEAVLDAALNLTTARTTATPLNTLWRRALDRLGGLIERQQRQDSPLIGVPTGFTELDRMTGGWRKGDLIILAGRPATGKTSLAATLAMTAAEHNCAVAIFSLEMSEDSLMDRIMAMRAGVDLQHIRNGRLSDDELTAISEAAGRDADLPVVIDESVGVTVAALASRIRRAQAHGPLDLVVVDYLQLLQPPDGDEQSHRQSKRHEVIGEMARRLKLVARAAGVPIIALSQLSRAVEQRQNKTPLLSDLAESSGLENNADVVIMLSRDAASGAENDAPNAAMVHVMKHRNGPTGAFGAYFQSNITRYKDMPTGAQQPGNGADYTRRYAEEGDD
jgi:replicative DNA helicase